MQCTVLHGLKEKSIAKTIKQLEKIRKGRISVDLEDIWKIFGEILPLPKSNEKPKKPQQKPRKNQEQNILLLFRSFYPI